MRRGWDDEQRNNNKDDDEEEEGADSFTVKRAVMHSLHIYTHSWLVVLYVESLECVLKQMDPTDGRMRMF